MELCEVLAKEAAEHYLVSDIKRDILKFDTVLLHSNWSKLRRKYFSKNSNRLKRVELWAKSIKYFGNFGRHFSCASSAKILAALSHIMGPTPILEMARAYGIRPRLWLLLKSVLLQTKATHFETMMTNVDEVNRNITKVPG